MVRSRFGLKALGLCVLVLGLMGISAGVAQAEGGKWFYEKAELKAELKPSLEGEIDGSATLKTKIIGKEVKFTCKEATLVSVKLEPEGKLTTGGSVKFGKCVTFLGGVESKACEPFTGAEKGVVVTDKGKGLLALHTGGITTTIIEPEVAGKAFGTIHMSELCSIGEEVPVFGKLFIKDTEVSKELVKHLITEGPLTSLYVISDTAEHLETKIEGGAKVFLGSTHASKSETTGLWSALAK